MKFSNENTELVVMQGSMRTLVKDVSYIVFYQKTTIHSPQEVGADQLQHTYEVLGMYQRREDFSSLQDYKTGEEATKNGVPIEANVERVIDYSKQNPLLTESIIDYLKTKSTV